MKNFVYNGLPARVIFGAGTLSTVAEVVADLGCRRALLLSTAVQREQLGPLQRLLGAAAVGAFTEAVMHTPVDVTERAVVVARDLRADCLIALGGGSTIGLAKAIALRTDLPQIAIPTTYAGSEMTPIRLDHRGLAFHRRC